MRRFHHFQDPNPFRSLYKGPRKAQHIYGRGILAAATRKQISAERGDRRGFAQITHHTPY